MHLGLSVCLPRCITQNYIAPIDLILFTQEVLSLWLAPLRCTDHVPDPLKNWLQDSSPLRDRLEYAIKEHHDVKHENMLQWKIALWRYRYIIASEGLSSMIALLILQPAVAETIPVSDQSSMPPMPLDSYAPSDIQIRGSVEMGVEYLDILHKLSDLVDRHWNGANSLTASPHFKGETLLCTPCICHTSTITQWCNRRHWILTLRR